MVTTCNDAGPGSLRWAIEQSNTTPGRDVIIGGPLCTETIALLSALPPITGPAAIVDVSIDGKQAGPADGFVVNADYVEFDDVWVTNFDGSGFVLRGQTDVLANVKSEANRNGIRIDGSFADIEQSEFDSNRDTGIWVTSQSTHDQIGAPPTICGIIVEGCSIQRGNYVAGNANKGIWLEGTLNTVDSDEIGSLDMPNGTGIVVSGAHNTVINCNVSYNQGDGIFLGVPAVFESNTGGCNGGRLVAGVVIAPPVITRNLIDPSVMIVSGVFHGEPNGQYKIEIQQSPDCPDRPSRIVATTSVGTDGTGFGTWTGLYSLGYPRAGSVFVMANRTDHEETSGPSDAVIGVVTGEKNADLSAETTGPATAMNGEEIEFDTVVRNNGPAAIADFRLNIPRTAGTSPVSASTTSGHCYLYPYLYCDGSSLGPSQSATIRERVLVTAGSGTLTHIATASRFQPYGITSVDPQPANDTATVTVNVSAAVPALSPVGLLLLSAALAVAGIFVRRTS